MKKNIPPSDLLPGFFFNLYFLSSWKTGASSIVWLVVVKARCLLYENKSLKNKSKWKRSLVMITSYRFWCSAQIPYCLTSKGAEEYASMWPHDCRITLRKGGKCLEGKKSDLALGSGSQTVSGVVKSEGCSLSHWEVPVGQTEMLWFPFKMLLYLGNWRKGVSTWSHVTRTFHCLEFLTTVKRPNAVMSVLQSERTVSFNSKGM